ncbi:MAG: uracil-DNA glycosylase family protein [Erythrobacter sp.]
MSAPEPDTSTVALHRDIAACRICAEHLPHGPRPVVQFSSASRICIIGQAPGSRVHASGVPWDDDSGDRLRDWLGLDKAAFYDPGNLALIPMGFCYPGKVKSGDAPPRRECAPQWHDRILNLLPENRLTLLVGSYAQAHYLPETRKLSLTQRVRRWAEFGDTIPLPHPSWRVRIWLAKNPWFETDLKPALQDRIGAALAPAQS